MLKFKFDLQLFAEDNNFEIPGIDPEIAKQIAEEYNEGNKEDEDVDDAADGSADADSDNKPVANSGDDNAADTEGGEQQADGAEDFDDTPEGGKIPYPRFKELNQRRKDAEAKVKELEAKLKAFEEGKQTTAPPAPAANLPFKQQQAQAAQQPAPAQQQTGGSGEFSAKQIERIAQMAIARAKAKLNLTDDDVENLDYSDKPELKVAYNNLVSEEMRNIRKEVQQYVANQEALNKQFDDTAQEFDTLGNKLGAYADARERWDFIGDKHFKSLPQRQQQVLNDAFMRLQHKHGTYADMYLINDYFDRANKLYEQQKAGAAAANSAAERTNNKMNSVRNLPKAPGVTGGVNSDKVLTPERVEQIIANPDLWNKLSEAERRMVLSGTLR